MRSLSYRIREARKLVGISRAELARHIGVMPSAAAQWEHQHGTAPTVRNLIKIASVTAVSFEWLATGRGPVRSKTLIEVPTVRTEDFTHNLFEEQVLLLMREIPIKWRDPLVHFLRAILGKKS